MTLMKAGVIMDEGRNGLNISKERTTGSEKRDKLLIEEAAGECDTATCTMLIEQGADVNARDEDGNTPLLWAVLAGNMQVVLTMLRRGADLNCKNNEGETPLHWAAVTGSVEVASLLIQGGADANVADEVGITPIRSAELNEDMEMVEFLRSHGAK